MRGYRVIITDCDFGRGEVEAGELGGDFDVRFLGAREGAAFLDGIRDADVLMVQYARIDGPVMDAAPNLKGIVRFGMGLDNIDLIAADDRGIAVRNVDDYCIDEVAEHAVAMIASSSRRLWQFDRTAKSGAWRPELVRAPRPPAETPVGIAGFGRIGRGVAARVHSLGYPVSFWDADVTAAVPDWAARADSLSELAERCTFLSLHVPLTPETVALVDATVLKQLGADGYLINVGRGGLVDEPALIRALDEGSLAGACLDVLAQEPPASGVSATLLQHHLVLITPHVAYLSTRALDALRRHAADRARQILS